MPPLLRSPIAISPGTTLNTDQGATYSTSPTQSSKADDSELTSFIDALWDEQMANSTSDFCVPEQRLGCGSLGSFGNLHLIHSDAATTQTIAPGRAMQPTYPYRVPASSEPIAMHEIPEHSSYSSDGLSTSPVQDHQSWHNQTGLFCNDADTTQDTECGCQQPSYTTYAPFDGESAWCDLKASQTPSQVGTNDGLDATEITEPCYARLLHKCLRETPNHTLTLKEIYAWIRQHTQKARDPKNKGWQNSVRHNLSMNAAFERVSTTTDNGETKKGSLWRLTSQAMRDGVISTTRYRRDPKRKSNRRGVPAPKRQMSGAKGGAATRAASQARRQLEVQERLARAAYSRAQQRIFTSAPTARFSMAPLPGFGQIPSCQPMPKSPYFVSSTVTSPTAVQSSYSDPYTPFQVQLPWDEQQKGLLGDWQLAHIDYNQGLFGNVDSIRDYSPSLQTESSGITDGPLAAPPNTAMTCGFW